MVEAARIARRGRARQDRARSDRSSMPYVPGLDGLRALAVLAVMVYHADSSWLPGGFIGVEVFFVISGYLITLLLIGEHERSGRISLGQFYVRRGRRLLPALFTMMALLVVYTALFRREELARLRGDVLAGLGYVSNWYQIWVGQGYTAAGEFAPLRHLWSLAVEEQFYLLWPVVMIGLIRLGGGRLPSYSRWLLLAAVGITVAVGLLYESSPAIDVATTPDAFWQVGESAVAKTDVLYLSTITRSTGLLVGAALAMLWRPVAVMRGPLRHRGRALDVLAVIGLGSLAVLAWQLHIVTASGADARLFRGGFLAVDLATMLLIAAVTHRRALTGRLLGVPVLLWVGTRSYGLYLFHWPIYQMVRGVAGNPLDLVEFLGALVATAVVTELCYRLIEMPVRRRRLGAWFKRAGRRAGPIGRRAIGFGLAGSITIVGVASASMVTAELQPTDIEQSLEQGEEVVVDLATESTATESTATESTATESTATASSAVAPTPAVATMEPATTEVATTEPATTEAATTEPATTEAATTEPATTEVATTEPATTEPATTEPATTEVATTEPATTEPATTEVATTELATTEAATTEPATTELSTTELSTTEAPTTTIVPAATASPTTTAAPTTTGPPPTVVAIGDSVMLGAAAELAGRGVVVDAVVSRQMVDYLPIVQQLAAEGQLGDVVVVHLGTNGPFSESTMTSFFDALAGVPTVIVLTVHADRPWVARNNELLDTLPGRYANVRLVDWDAAVAGCAGDCLYEDGIHLPPDGRRYYAQLIFDEAGI